MSSSGENKEAEGFGPSSDLQPLPGGSVAPEEVLAGRGGEVLLRHTILKSDHFPGCQNMKLTPLLEGAPNFRQVPDLPVYGVAIPTASGLRNVLDRIGASKGRKRVVWLNLREEPVIYINGKPFVVREADKPFANLEYTGIDRERVENMETRLKADVLVEAGLYGGAIMVAHEDDQFQVIEDWEPVTDVDVQTPAEVYAELKDDGYDVDYLRVPITDEKAPKDGDFESLIAKCWTPPTGAALVFNCQMGRGRTTTGMVIGCLLTLRKIRGMLAPPPRMISDGIPPWYISMGELPLSPLATAAAVGAKGSFEEIEYKHGMFAVVRSLLRALERGREAKACLDLVIDACSAMQNLREAINSYRMRLLYEPNDMRRQSILQVCLEYLDRYYSLITFATYLDDPGFNPHGEREDRITFAQWTAARPELRGILQRLLRSNPFNALALDQATSPLATKESELDRDGESLSVRTEEDEYEELLACRSGSVLGPHTILKQDHFPGCQSSRIPALFQGAPNFRGVGGKGIEVYGGAIATVDGVRQVLDYLGAAPVDVWKEGEGVKEEHPKDCRHAVWHMMREEPVVYINGLPYVLREERRPFKNLMEYRGIDAERLDQMEQRLRDDVIAESSMHGGKILVSLEGELGQDGQETYHGPRQKYVTVQGPEAVETPRSVFEALQRLGYRVTFLRIPLTDGTCPRPSDFDAFYGAVVDAGANDALIYTCQLGGGRTTTGMAIGVLLRMHLNGSARLPQASDLQRRETLDRLDEDLGGGSPRGTSDDECEDDRRQDPTAGSEQQATPKVEHSVDWETKNMEDGEYVAVRRFTRTLERGVEAKNKVDEVVDACGVLINLRTAIMRYRRPKTTEKFFRPEIQARHSAFQRGSAYLERYCMLIAFGAYLRLCHHQRQWQNTGVGIGIGVGAPFLSFQEWLSARPDVSSAREFIHQNPTSALAPVPPVLPFSTSAANMATNAVGMTPMPPSTAGKGHISAEEQRQVLFRRKGSTVGRRTILKSFTVPQLSQLGMEEEAVMMIRLSVGVTDICKAVDRPVFTVGNATVVGLRQLLSHLGARPGGNTHVVVTDVREELVLYVNGTAYLRRELEMPAAALHHAGIQSAKLEDLERRLRADMITEAMNWGGRVLLHREVEEEHNASRLPGDSKGLDDITRTTEYQPRTKVTAFWESTGDMGDIDMGMCTPLEVFVGLAAEGFQLSYRRVPLSRERTPQALDLDHLHLQMRSIPGGKEAVYMFISRTATGSSTRFAAAFACCILNSQSELSMSTMKDNDLKEASPLSPPTSKRFKQSNALFRHDSDASDLERSVLAGEYRGVMNLCRVLPGGAEAKAAVDQAIDACKSIGNLRLDILKCKDAANQEVMGPESSSAAAAARHLGLHYLQRYFFLIAFRAFLDSDGDGVFSEWVSQRPEINYLLSTLDLE